MRAPKLLCVADLVVSNSEGGLDRLLELGARRAEAIFWGADPRLWQIAARSDLPFDDLVRLDFYYLENWSLWLDVTILIKSIPAVVGRRGAY